MQDHHDGHHRHHASGRGVSHEHDHGPHAASGEDHHAHMVGDFRRRFWISLFLSIPVLALSTVLHDVFGIDARIAFPGDRLIEALLASVVFFYGGWPFLTGLIGEVRKRQPGMMTLIGVAITVAYTYSTAVVLGLPGMVFYWELVTLIDVMLLGHWIEMRSVLGASAALESLARLLPSDAHVRREDGSTEDVPVASLRAGDRVLVKPGEKVPVDGMVIEGRTSMNEAMLTGESKPVDKTEGDTVIAGSVNGEAAVIIEVRKTGAETYLAQVIELVRKTQQSRSRTQDIANRAAFWLTLIALFVGTGSFLIWLFVGQEFIFALERGVTVMVIACPHALGLAVPLVVSVSTTRSASQGLLIRDRSAFERARDIDAILFDKTGTLTEGRFGVSDVLGFDVSEEEILALAASVESRSEHPIAQGIVRTAQERGIAYEEPADVTAIPGKGVRGTVGGADVRVVSPGSLREQGMTPEDRPDVRTLVEQGKTVVYVLRNDHPVGVIALADIIRSSSREVVRALKERGVRVMMLTGDAAPVAAWVARELDLDEYFAEVLPQDKAAKVREVQERGFVTAMAGDGINDAPALTQADVGIAVGAGTDVAIESADIVLVRSDPRDILLIASFARATYRKMVQNLWWATGYNIVAIPLAAGVLYRYGILLSPAFGAALMALSTVIVAVNARFLRVSL